MKRLAIFCLSFLCCFAAEAKLFVKLSTPKVTGSKAVVKVEIKNGFKEKVESARAQLFLLDAEGKVVGQASEWVVGLRNADRGLRNENAKETVLGLAPDAHATFNFVVEVKGVGGSLAPPDLSPQLKFTRIVLEGGKLADPKAVEISTEDR